MDFSKYRRYPIIGGAVFGKPQGGITAWVFFGLTLLFVGLLSIDRGAKVALVVGIGLILFSAPQLLAEKHYVASVILRLIAVVYYVTIWIVILVSFPDVSTFFEGGW